MESLFSQETKNKVFNRINQLTPGIKPEWGSMRADQMLTHCQLPLEVSLGYLKLDPNIGFLKKLVFKLFKPALYNDKPFRPNIPTPKEFEIMSSHDFAEERDKLIAVIDQFHNLPEDYQFPDHPYFGKFNNEQWGKMQYKHLDHHLRQFGV
ncbi:MAG: hypothetical protein BM564_10235 [Bacteroidetes bacterium MedPE-SWsnd-G2]|nr:MAG: hypothetical protein BM564_10235 [Bacteroidetes bacterium MedPE-SWsnd-G2]